MFTLLKVTFQVTILIMAILQLFQKLFIFLDKIMSAHIAQLVEHFHGKEKVVCSIHTVGTRNKDFF